MKRLAILMMAGTVLAGCLVVPAGYDHHYYHDASGRYWDNRHDGDSGYYRDRGPG